MKTSLVLCHVSAIAVLMCLSGCLSISGRHTYWADAYEPTHNSGPGREDARFETYSYNKYEVDDGKCISIGLFPGYAMINHPLEDGRTVKDDEWFTSILAYNVLYGVPGTLASLLYTPFCAAQCDPLKGGAFGLVGCCRWKEPPKEPVVLKKKKEERIVRARSDASPETDVCPSTFALDKTKLYFIYPGFDQIAMDVRKNRRVDVLFQDGLSARRFTKARYVKDALTYEDWDVAQDPELNAQAEFYRRCRNLRTRLAATTRSEYNTEKGKFAQLALREVNDALMSKSIPDPDYRMVFDARMKTIIDELEGRKPVTPSQPEPEKDSQDTGGGRNGKTEFDL